MFVGGKPDRRAENYGDAAVEVWCEGSGTAPRSARTPAAAPLTAAAPPPRPPPELAADLPGLAAYIANRAAWRAACGEEHSGGALPPPFLRDPRSECPRLDAPFVTDEVGGLPVLPDDLEQALAAYLPEADEESSSGEASAAEAPEVGLDGSGKAAASSLRREGLRALLREADAQGQRYWAAVACPRLRQPPWWPLAACGPDGVGAGRGSVPLYDQVIVGPNPNPDPNPDPDPNPNPNPNPNPDPDPDPNLNPNPNPCMTRSSWAGARPASACTLMPTARLPTHTAAAAAAAAAARRSRGWWPRA
eukprot:scaffold80540_cov60-Phaeocystis_antarctica.AAC.2